MALAPETLKLGIMMSVEPQARETRDNEAISPEDMKLETGEIIINPEAAAHEASDSKVITPDDMKLETGEIVMNVETPANEASYDDLYLRKMEHGIVYEEETEQLEESYDSLFKGEESDSLRGRSDIEEDILVQSSPTQKSGVANGQLRKNTVLVVGSNHKFNVRSRYLSDSVVSCHDFCKFGHKHESEKKTRRLTLGTIRESQPLIKTTHDDLENCVVEKVTNKKELHRLSLPSTMPEKSPLIHLEEKIRPKDINQSKMTCVQSERKSSSFQSPTTSSRSKTATQAVKKIVNQSPNLQKTSTQKLKEVKTRKEVGSNGKGEMEVNGNEPMCSSSGTSLNEEADYCQGVNEIKAKKPMCSSSGTSLNKDADYRQGVNEIKAKKPMCSSSGTSLNEEADYNKGVNEIKAKKPISNSRTTTQKYGYSKVVKDIKAKEPKSNSPKTPLKRSPSLKARLYKNRKSSFNSRNQINPVEPKVGHDATIETNPNMEPAEKNSKTTIYGENSQHSIQEARTRQLHGSKGNWKGIGASLLSFSSRESSKPHGEKPGSEVTKNKQIGSKTDESGSKNSMPRAKSTATRLLKSIELKNIKQNDIIRNDSRSRTNTSREKSTVERKWIPKMKEKSNVEEKDASAWKVKFKRGTVIALQVANNAPKRLRFRRARSLGEDQNAKAEIDRQSKNELLMGNEPHDKVGPEKVRLRHQETSEKKDDIDLNNVIEETASKLVKTRKSKVKALVGAFETVMSLGDRKHLVETGAS